MEDAGLTADEVAALKAKLSISLQEVYDAGKSLSALLGNHENVYVRITSDGNLLQESYLSKQYFYFFYGTEFMDMGFEYAGFVTDNAEYYCFENVYALNITLAPDGMVEATELLALAGSNEFISTEVLHCVDATIVEKDGFLVVTCTMDPDAIVTMGSDIISCVEAYTLDARTREMTAIKTTYTYADGTIEEDIVTITRDVEEPEGIEPFLAYAQETENVRTVTIVSNPGAENEKTDTVRVPKGLQVGFALDFPLEETFMLYADAACTQVFTEPDAHSDLTVYVKWEE